MLVVLITAAIVAGIGELLLLLAEVEEEIGVIREPYAVIVALFLALVVLIGAAVLDRGGRNSGV